MFSVEQLVANVLFSHLDRDEFRRIITTNTRAGWERSGVLYGIPQHGTGALVHQLRSLSVDAWFETKRAHNDLTRVYPQSITACYMELPYGTSIFQAHWHFDFLSLCCMWALENPHVPGGQLHFRERYKRLIYRFCSLEQIREIERLATVLRED